MSEHTKLPNMFIDPASPGIIRWDNDNLTGILAGVKAAEIVRAVNSHADLLAALQRMLDVYLTPHPRTERMEADAQARIAIAKATAQ